MTIGRPRASILVAAIALFALSTSPAHALNSIEKKCVSAIAKASQGFVKGKLKLLQKCKNAQLKDASCPAPDAGAVTKLETKLSTSIAKGCAESNLVNIQNLGFPGP